MAQSVELRLAGAIAVLAPGALLAGAYISQYGFGLFPCEMCWWQRYPHFAALAFGLFAWIRPSTRWPVGLAAISLAISGLIGAYHAGVEYGWWEGVSACTTIPASAGSDPMEAILNAPIVRCDRAPWSLMGVSLAGWNFLFSVASALAIMFLLRREGRSRR